MIQVRFFIVFLLLIILAAAASLIIHDSQKASPLTEGDSEYLVTTPPPNLSTSSPPVSVEELVGQHFIVGHWADKPVASTTELIKKHHLGGVVIMSAPEDSSIIKDWTNAWQAVSDQPLFIAIDQEGGPVSRLKGSAFIQTSQREIYSTSTAYEVGQKRGQELSALGININFAPVLDSAGHTDSFMYDRVFPSRADSPALSAAMLEGMNESAVLGAVKHFPGHADTSEDSHTTLPTVDISLAALDTFTDPFQELITNNPPAALMTAHVLFPQIDLFPASLSRFFLTDYLRQDLNFSGIIITDDMSMKAVTETWTSDKASVLSLQAGADMVLFAAEPTKVTSAVEATLVAVGAGHISTTSLKTSYDRIINTKQSLP